MFGGATKEKTKKIQIWKKTCVDKVFNAVQLLVQLDGETYYCCENLLAHVIEITAKYM